MKKYFLRFTLLSLSLSTLVSCDEDTVTYNGGNFVQFENVASTGIVFREDAGIAEVPVLMAFAKSTDVTVNFTITSEVAVVGEHYNVLTPNSITIPAGQTSANIRIELIDNDIIDASKPLFITLTGVSDSDVKLGLGDEGSAYKRFLIRNDDCTTGFDQWVGDLIVKKAGVAVADAKGEFTEEGDCNQLLVTGDFAAGGRETTSPIIFTFTPSSPGSRTGTITTDWQLYCEKCYTEDGIDYNIEYSVTNGSYNENTNVITVTGQARLDANRAFAPETITFTPVQP